MAAPTSPPDPGTDDDSADPVGEHRQRHPVPNDRATTDDAVELVTLVDDTTDGRRCTICPADSDATDLVTTWLTVDADVLCDLDDWR